MTCATLEDAIAFAEEDAIAFAEEKATEIENGRVRAGNLSASDLQGYYRAVVELGKMDCKFPPRTSCWRNTSYGGRGPAVSPDYATYRIAEISNVGRLAEEIGTSIDCIKADYDAVPADIDPKACFGVMRESSTDSETARKIPGLDGVPTGA